MKRKVGSTKDQDRELFVAVFIVIIFFSIYLFVSVLGENIRNIVLNVGRSIPYSQNANAIEWNKEVKVYFLDQNKKGVCKATEEVVRVVPNAETLGPGAVDALVKGPTDSELRSGIYSDINKKSLIQSFQIVNGIAYIDFTPDFMTSMGDSCTIKSVKSQIENTLTTLPDIDSIVISINNEPIKF